MWQRVVAASLATKTQCSSAAGGHLGIACGLLPAHGTASLAAAHTQRTSISHHRPLHSPPASTQAVS